ncbi:hypothetical protein Hypma_003771 [Hypsizygus marmoreus]|uniref:Uncharacterized protein n=1 Tax=Hypsizygus marmoreus TaxID=39966 RepID=A0A369K1X3_HYPMA|nr:hypothetical protein Hypma_003771 [Hypsizygus marmoreus]
MLVHQLSGTGNMEFIACHSLGGANITLLFVSCAIMDHRGTSTRSAPPSRLVVSWRVVWVEELLWTAHAALNEARG